MYRDNTWFSPIRHLKLDGGVSNNAKSKGSRQSQVKAGGRRHHLLFCQPRVHTFFWHSILVSPWGANVRWNMIREILSQGSLPSSGQGSGSVQFSSVAQSCLTLRLHGLQHARPPCQAPALAHQLFGWLNLAQVTLC